MRSLGLSVVCLSLLLGAGGVVSRPQAQTTHPEGDAARARSHAEAATRSESANSALAGAGRQGTEEPRPGERRIDALEDRGVRRAQREFDAAVADLSRADAPAKACGATSPQLPVRIQLSNVEPPKNFISLNTRGYNYRQPGEPPHFVPNSTGTPRVPPSDAP